MLDKNYDKKKRSAIDEAMRNREFAKPKVGISNRGARGFINDATVFSKAQPGFVGESLPPGFTPLDWSDERSTMDRQLQDIRSKRSPGLAKSHINQVSGLFIPGGQDREKDGSPEKLSRESYEMALVKAARNRGVPTMAVCGGSRSLARGYGAEEQSLNKAQKKIHKAKDQTVMAHPIVLRDPHLPDSGLSPMREDNHTLVGGAAPMLGQPPSISSVNSTHEKVVAHQSGQIEPVNRLPGTDERELMTSAWHEDGTPEGFETRYGAPIVGITSHPEAIHTDEETIKGAPADAVEWSSNLFKGFSQSMQAYDSRQAVNAELFGPIAMARKARPDTFKKWYGKRNWQKLQQLGMISDQEAEEMQASVQASRAAKSQSFKNGTWRDRDRNY